MQPAYWRPIVKCEQFTGWEPDAQFNSVMNQTYFVVVTRHAIFAVINIRDYEHSDYEHSDYSLTRPFSPNVASDEQWSHWLQKPVDFSEDREATTFSAVRAIYTLRYQAFRARHMYAPVRIGDDYYELEDLLLWACHQPPVVPIRMSTNTGVTGRQLFLQVHVPFLRYLMQLPNTIRANSMKNMRGPNSWLGFRLSYNQMMRDRHTFSEVKPDGIEFGPVRIKAPMFMLSADDWKILLPELPYPFAEKYKPPQNSEHALVEYLMWYSPGEVPLLHKSLYDLPMSVSKYGSGHSAFTLGEVLQLELDPNDLGNALDMEPSAFRMPKSLSEPWNGFQIILYLYIPFFELILKQQTPESIAREQQRIQDWQEDVGESNKRLRLEDMDALLARRPAKRIEAPEEKQPYQDEGPPQGLDEGPTTRKRPVPSNPLGTLPELRLKQPKPTAPQPSRCVLQ